jgi:hypothetical protein
MEKALPGVRPNGIAEDRIVFTPPDAIHASFLFVSPAEWEVVKLADLVVDDRAIASDRTDDTIALLL